jgi:hypothetical protein
VSTEKRLAALESQIIASALEDWDAVIDWLASWMLANCERELTPDTRLSEDEQARMLADMPAELQARAARAWPIVEREREH